MAFKEVSTFHGLDDRGLMIRMCCANVSGCERPLDLIAFHLPVHRRNPLEEAIVSVPRLIVGGKGHANR